MNLFVRIAKQTALAGFVLSLIAHLAALLHAPVPFGERIMLLHGGIFVVFIPAVFLMHRLSDGFDRRDAWKAGLRGCPTWMRRVAPALFVYTIANFLFRAVLSGSGELTLRETIALMSGHWMLFYGAAYAIMHSWLRVQESDPAPRCRNGHRVSYRAEFCERCGEPVAGGRELVAGAAE